MDATTNLVMGAIILVIGLCFGLWAWTVFRTFKRLNETLNRAHEMTESTTAVISDIVKVRRRNSSFRWTNEYPVFSYQVDGKTYTVHMSYAEARRGKYSLGGNYTAYYVPNDPECCIIDEFRGRMQKSRTNNLIAVVVLAILTFNLVSGAITTMLGFNNF